MSQEVYIVHGAPASGKTTYVKQHMQDGDLVVDLDYIKYALTFRGKGELGDNLMPIAFDVRDMLYEKIEARDVDAKNIWIIASLPRKEERHRLATRLNAKLIHCHATVHECIDRAMNDIERVDKELQIKIIDKYFANYES
ncbi:MAG: AAA family ATPase [Turicibacter sp.]